MAGKDCKKPAISLTEELVQKIQPKPYKKYVAKLREDDAVTGENYKNSKVGQLFHGGCIEHCKKGQSESKPLI